MGSDSSGVKESRVLLTGAQVEEALHDLAAKVKQAFPSPQRLAILGIRTRGAFLADRLKELLEAAYEMPIGLGALDITFYRDDLSQIGPHPMVHGSELPFDISDANVVLVDDVLFTGRTVRAALDEISDYGRPAVVRLLTLVDRGLRELPIQPDYCALRIETTLNQRVRVMVEEVDDEDGVVLDTLEG